MSGLRILISDMYGKEAIAIWQNAIGKEITALHLGEDNALHFAFGDGTRIRVLDNGQCCCEYRYMVTDDNLAQFIGATLLDGEVRDAPNEPDEDGNHEVQFLLITTSKGVFTMASHNEHNGYYGGFDITVKTD